MNDTPRTDDIPKDFSRRSWRRKFQDAGRGIWITVRGQSSFAVHLCASIAVVGASALLQVSRVEWCLLTLCIALVMTAELLNTSLEQLAKVNGHEFNAHIRDALDIGSGAVLAAAIGAAVTGGVILLPHLLRLFSFINP